MKVVFKVLTKEFESWKDFDKYLNDLKKIGTIKTFYLKVAQKNVKDLKRELNKRDIKVMDSNFDPNTIEDERIISCKIIKR